MLETYLKTFTVVASGLFAVYGAVCLLAAWYFPALLRSSLFRRAMTTGRLEPTRANRTILSCYSMSFGCIGVLSTLGYDRMSYVALAAFTLFAFAGIARSR
jgi:hypothetical protein